MEENNQEKGIFINGKQQMIDMLKYMDIKERKKLIGLLSNRNASVARELSELSVSYNDLQLVDDEKLSLILRYSNPSIIGLALYLSPTNFQRRCLKLMNREEAEKAFEVMQYDLSMKKSECRKAQQKILNTAVELIRDKTFTL